MLSFLFLFIFIIYHNFFITKTHYNLQKYYNNFFCMVQIKPCYFYKKKYSLRREFYLFIYKIMEPDKGFVSNEQTEFGEEQLEELESFDIFI